VEEITEEITDQYEVSRQISDAIAQPMGEVVDEDELVQVCLSVFLGACPSHFLGCVCFQSIERYKSI